MNKLKYILLIFFLYVTGDLLAQTTVLSGTVYEKVGGKKEPAIGVNVVIQNGQNRFLTGTTTNLNGTYSLRIPTDEKGVSIMFTFVGMKSQTVKYTGQKTIDVTMEEDAQELEAVTVTAQRINHNYMGITDKEQTSATQRVKMDDIMETSPVTSVEEALQGRLSGVDIISGGDPGARSSIRIRGTSTLNGSAEPLIVINGVPYNTDIDDDFNFQTANDEDFATLLNISPADIESIEVLKDASATAIWGTAGANGVLMITTKKGTRGKTNFNFSTKFSTKFEPDPIPMLNGKDYVALMQDAIWNTANAYGVANNVTYLKLLYDTPEINYMQDWRYFNEYNANTDWLSEVKRNTFTTDNNFAMSGGGEKATYRFSLGYMYEGGTTVGTSVDRLSSNLNVTYNFSDRLRVDAEFSFTQTQKESNWINVRSEALRKMPNKSPYWIDDETGQPTDRYFTRQNSEEFQGAFNGKQNFHPIIMAKDSRNSLSQREEKITFRLNYNFLAGLTYTGYISMNYNTYKTKKFLPQSATGVAFTNAYANQSSDAYSDKFSLQTENRLMYRHTFNDIHSLLVTGLFRTSQTQNSSYSTVVYGVSSPGLSDPTTGGAVSSQGSGNSEGRSISAIGNMVYTLLNKYTASATVNMEANASLGKSNRRGIFPAFGVNWQMHEEGWLKDKEWLEQAKIRLSWGKSGKSPKGTAPYAGTFKSLGDNYIDMSAIEPASMQLNKLKWESTAEWNVGADFGFLTGRLNFTMDYYYKYTKDLLQTNVSIPSSTGFPKIAYFNSGELSNNGIEFRVDYKAYKSKDWEVNVGFNISHNKNQIEKLPANLTEESYTFGNGKYAKRLTTNTPVGSFFGYHYLGVYQNTNDTYARDAEGNIMHQTGGTPVVMKNGTTTCYPGDAKYADINHDGMIDKNDIIYLGNYMPSVEGGGSLSVKWKTLTLSTFLHYRIGQKVINRQRMNNEAMYGRDNQSTAVLKRWKNEGDNTDIPRALYNYGYNYLGSDRFVEKCSYVRLQSLSLNYAIPKTVCRKWGINSMSVFVTGYDLFTWTDYTGQDPEITLPTSPTSLLEDNSDTPRAIRFAAGLNINF